MIKGWAVRGALCNHCRCIFGRGGKKLSAIHSMTDDERAEIKRKSLVKCAEANFTQVCHASAMKTKKQVTKQAQEVKDAVGAGSSGGVTRTLKKAATI